MISKRNKTKLAGIIIITILIGSICIFIYWSSFKDHNMHPVSDNTFVLDEPNQVAIEQSFDTIDSNVVSSSIEQNNEVDLPLDPRAAPEYIVAIEQVPVHPWHTERVNNIRSESIEQLIENIANFDDYQFAITSNGRGYFPGEMDSETECVVNLFRVRRLFEEGQRNPEQVIPILKKAYNKIHNTWIDCREEKRQRMIEIKRILKENGSLLSTALHEPDSYMKNRTGAIAITYLLAELQNHDSLPILLEGYQKHRNWIDEEGAGKMVVPVPTPMTLYAIHRLAVTLPENAMDSQTLAARNAYLQWAEKYVPDPEIMKVTAWNADYDESDPYRRIADPEGKVLTGQPSILMAKYPYKLKDGTFFF